MQEDQELEAASHQRTWSSVITSRIAGNNLGNWPDLGMRN